MTQFEVVQRYLLLAQRYMEASSWRNADENYCEAFRKLQSEITPAIWNRYTDHLRGGGWYPAPMDAGWVARTCRKLFVVENTP